MKKPTKSDGAVNPCSLLEYQSCLSAFCPRIGKDRVAVDVLEATEHLISNLAIFPNVEECSVSGM